MIDLHTHTIYSDGEYTPLELINMCNESGITTVAITDHNTIEGAKQALLVNPHKNITVIPGIEFGALYNVKGADLHILGLNVDVNNLALNNISKVIMQDNIERIKSIFSLLKTQYNLSFKDADIEQVFNSIGNIGRPDVAKLCVTYGYAKDVEDAFKNLLNPIHHLVAKRKHELTDKACIEYIIQAGGIPCLAHPFTLKKDFLEVKAYVKTLISYGLEAIEVFHSQQSPEYSNQLMTLVNELSLLYSVGSDFHGPIVTPDVILGCGKNNNLNRDTATILSKIIWGN